MQENAQRWRSSGVGTMNKPGADSGLATNTPSVVAISPRTAAPAAALSPRAIITAPYSPRGPTGPALGGVFMQLQAPSLTVDATRVMESTGELLESPVRLRTPRRMSAEPELVSSPRRTRCITPSSTTHPHLKAAASMREIVGLEDPQGPFDRPTALRPRTVAYGTVPVAHGIAEGSLLARAVRRPMSEGYPLACFLKRCSRLPLVTLRNSLLTCTARYALPTACYSLPGNEAAALRRNEDALDGGSGSCGSRTRASDLARVAACGSRIPAGQV